MTSSGPNQTASWSGRLMVLTALGGAVLTLAHPSATRQVTWPWIFLLTLVWLTPLAVLFGSFFRATVWKRPDGLLGIGLGVLVFGTVASAFLSPFPVPSLLRIWPTLAGTAAFFWLYHWLDEPAPNSQRKRSGSLIQGVACFAAIVAIVSLLGWRWQAGAAGSWAVRNDVPFGHSTYTAGALLLLLPWLVHASATSTGVRRLGWAFFCAAGFAALFATSSRGGVLAAGATGAAVAGLLAIRAQWSGRAKVLVFAGTALILVLAVFTNPRLRELVRDRNWGSSAKESNAQRSAMIDAGWQMGATRPLTGWGPGTVPLVYPQIRRHLDGGVDDVLQLHNTPAQVWATLGLSGILAMILLVSAVIRRLWQLGHDTLPGTHGLAAAAGVFGYGLFCLTDHQLDLPAMNALLVVNLVLLFQRDPDARRGIHGNGARRIATATALVIVAAPLWFTGRDLLARRTYDASFALFDAGKAEEGFARLESAAQLAPYDPYYRHQLASRLLNERAATRDTARQNQLAARAVAQLEQSLTAGCFQEFAHLNLGWLALDQAEPRRAASHFISAAREAPHRSGVYFGLGLALREAGDEAGAIRAFALEWLNEPVAYTAPVWEWPDFAPLRPKVEREAGSLLASLNPSYPAAYVGELWTWWANGSPLPSGNFNRESAAFVEMLHALARKEPPSPLIAQYPWGHLFAGWTQPPGKSGFIAESGNDAGFAAAVVRRKERHLPPDWHGFLSSGLENEPELLVNTRSERIGYGVLALHPDGPILSDLFVRQQNRFVSRFASTLFPPKGWIPARELIDRLPPLPPPAQ